MVVDAAPVHLPRMRYSAVMRRKETGTKALWALVEHSPVARTSVIRALKTLLVKHDGNATHAAKALGLSASAPLLALVDALDLRDWLDETWPERRAGGGLRKRSGRG